MRFLLGDSRGTPYLARAMPSTMRGASRRVWRGSSAVSPSVGCSKSVSARRGGLQDWQCARVKDCTLCAMFSLQFCRKL